MYRPLILTAIILVAVASSAAHASADWVSAVLDHPSLRVQNSSIEKQKWKILELEAEQGFDFDINQLNKNMPMTGAFGLSPNKKYGDKGPLGTNYLDTTTDLTSNFANSKIPSFS